ncbi:hypothetical protein G9C85_13010 [Halorubellus sp. JP-L1]|uniref:hypothetical protein n=1 Tax=Halorubellus sp. JP-L1 TaxID=2715753 RepID=UPI00140A2041|nr:hypothetical protein [Halorubellus sp. JP-L1]NHN42540.1 hypothetical protein [Halorubellus sp. JP-L1]
MTDAADDDRDVDFVLVDPEDADVDDAVTETGFVVVEDTDLVPAEDAPGTEPAVFEEPERGFVVRDPETEETGFVVVRDTDLVPVADPTLNYPAVIESVETDFVLVERDDPETTDFVLVDDPDLERDTGLVPVDPDAYALDTRPPNPRRNGHR